MHLLPFVKNYFLYFEFILAALGNAARKGRASAVAAQECNIPQGLPEGCGSASLSY